MTHKGVGARIRWTIDSPRALEGLRAIDEEIQLLEFEHGETEIGALLERYKAASTRGILNRSIFTDIGLVAERAEEALATTGADEQLSIHFQESHRLGVYRLSKRSFVNHAAQLLEFDGNSILATTADGKIGILLDIEIDGLGNPNFEIEYWSSLVES